ncbi:MAG: GPR endopeptidase [Clostridia bacterium]|nr:GPR endopeptidase [Clostridia bacterium]
MIFRTDIAIEANNGLNTKIDGVIVKNKTIDNLDITKVKVKTKEAGDKLNKPIGNYITIEVPILTESIESFESKAEIISGEISCMIPKKGPVLVTGLGNSDITADNLGPMTASNILATRHISKNITNILGLDTLRSVCVISPGVLAQTGIEVAEIIHSLIQSIKPCCTIIVDAFACSDIKRLGRTIQISDSGISPGSGVLNSRSKIDKETMGIPVISIGVPTVVDTVSVFQKIFNVEKSDIKNYISVNTDHMIITAREIDLLIKKGAKFLAMIINSLLHKNLTNAEIEYLMS